VEVVISNVPGSIHYITEYPVLESLYNVSVALTGTAPKLNTISPYRLKNLLLQHEFVMCG
jgi:hypothetical protein